MLQDINSVTDIEAAVSAVEEAIDTEETIYELEEVHPEGDFPAEIISARKAKNYIIVELETSEGIVTKFYTITKERIDQRFRYMLKAAGVPTNKFALSMLLGNVVTITVAHYEKDGETRASITNIK